MTPKPDLEMGSHPKAAPQTVSWPNPLWIALLLLMFAVVVSWDLFQDFFAGASWLHLAFEAALTLGALLSAFLSWRRYQVLKTEYSALRLDIQKLSESEQKWKQESARYVLGLSKAIDEQFERWGLTPAEKEVALLLLKGLSLKEVAEVRSCSERTARQHALSVYQKSGLRGRAELAAFFLEDLLSPGFAS